MGYIEEGDNARRVMMPEYGNKMLFLNCHPNYNGKGCLYCLEKSKFVHAIGLLYYREIKNRGGCKFFCVFGIKKTFRFELDM